MIAYITGSGFYDKEGFTGETVETPLGEVSLLRGQVAGTPCIILPRHGRGHHYLPHQINYRANLLALKQAGASAIVSFSVCGVTNPHWELAQLMVASDLFFPDNRLGDGQVCTLFTEPGEAGRGHLLAESLFHSGLLKSVASLFPTPPLAGTYGSVPGPRFNTQSEIRALQVAGVSFISQTCGPEAVLANELELPYALAGFGIDYANGVVDTPTPVERLNENLKAAKRAFEAIIDALREPEEGWAFQNFVYRFD